MALAEVSGVPQGTISKIERGDQDKSTYDGALSRALGVHPLWLSLNDAEYQPDWLGGSQSAPDTFRPSPVIALRPGDEIPDGFVAVQEFMVTFSAGNGHEVHYDLIENAEPATYRLSWFQRERIDLRHVKRFKVSGDSMEPLLFAGDSILVNLAENDMRSVIDGKVYAIRYDNELRVKRLYKRLDGTLILHSENPAYSDELVPPDLVDQYISIIGRVREKSGVGGM